MEKVKRIILFIASICLIVACIPFYIIYATGKTLCDMEEFEDFFAKVCDILMYPKERRNLRAALHEEQQKNTHLRRWIERIKEAPDTVNGGTAEKYNAMWDEIHKYNERYGLED